MANPSIVGGAAKAHVPAAHDALKALHSAISKTSAVSAAHKMGNDTLKLVSDKVAGRSVATKLSSAGAAGAGSKLVSAVHKIGSDTIGASRVKFSADTLSGGVAKSASMHADTISAHKDLFVFKSEHTSGSHVVHAFKGGTDKVVLSGYGKSELAAALSSQKVVAGNLTFKLSDKTSITIEGHEHKLSASDFIIK